MTDKKSKTSIWTQDKRIEFIDFRLQWTGKINRSEFGLTWSTVTEAGGVVVSDEIKLNMAVQMVKQA